MLFSLKYSLPLPAATINPSLSSIQIRPVDGAPNTQTPTTNSSASAMCCHTTCTYRRSAGDETLPLAVIVDGNWRWKRLRGFGGRCESLREVQELCCKFGVLVLSLFASFSENCFPAFLPKWK